MSNLARSLVLLLLLGSGCDTMVDAPPKLEEAKTNASGDRSGLAGCLHDCAGQDLSATDAATCRNNCEMAFKVTPTASEPALDAAAKCMHACHAGEGDPASCLKGCRQRAVRAGEAVDVLDRLGQCVGGCEGDKGLSATDRWTCVRNCSPAAKVAPPPTGPAT